MMAIGLRRQAWRALLLVALTLAVLPAGAWAKNAPVLSFSPSPVDFASVTAGSVHSKTLTLTNRGRSASGALKVSLSGSGAFTITTDRCSTRSLGPRKSCTVIVRFAPTASGVASATLTALGKKPCAHATDRLIGTVPAGQLYWIDFLGGVWKAGLDGSNPTMIVSFPFTFPLAVAVNSSHVYWSASAGGTIWAAGLDGSNPTQIVITGQNGPGGVAVDSSHLYWTMFLINNSGSAGTIWKAGLDGSNPTQIVITGQNGPGGVAVDSSHLYWTDPTAGTIWKAGLDGSNPTQIVSSQNRPFCVALDSSHLYWTDPASGTIWAAGLDGTNPTQIVSGINPSGLAVDNSHLYWADAISGTVWEAGLDGSNPTVIVTGQGSPRGDPSPIGLAVSPY